MRKIALLILLPQLAYSQIQISKDAPNKDDYFTIVNSSTTANIFYDTADFTLVQKSARFLVNDIEKVSGKRPELIQQYEPLKGDLIIIGSIGNNTLIDKLIADKKLDVSPINDQWERFIIRTIEQPFPDVSRALAIVGSDRRGTAYGVFTLSEEMGVSPWYWWADVPVEKSSSLYLQPVNYISKGPSVKYRGIFLNDEDWGLHPWAAKKMNPELNDIGPKTYSKVCELLLRLKANSLWPAMHGISGAFNKYPENKLVADSFGIVMGSSHHEPLLFNTSTEWNKQTMGEWDYSKNKNGILEQLEKRVKSNSPYENFYTLALRGLNDEGMAGDLTLAEKVENLQNALQDQRDILKEYIPKPINTIPQAFIPYKEVTQLYNKGARVPADVTIVWPDDNYGYIKQLATPDELNREGKFGVYYHVSYLGVPHNYLWMSTTPPVLMYEELSKALRTGADRYWVVNVGDIKACEYQTDLFLDMAWDFEKYSYENISQDHARWTASVFGAQYLDDFISIWNKFYHLAFVRKPEYMGWGRERWLIDEEITDTDFSFTNYGEAENRIREYDKIAGEVTRIMEQLPESQKPAFFQLVYYPVKGAGLMNKKMLTAQKNRLYAKQGRAKANVLAAEARSYYDSLQLITRQYNSLLNGKWEGMMSLQTGWNSKVHIMPEVDSLALPNEAILGVFPEGYIQCDSIPTKSLPVFNSFAPKEYYVDIANKGAKILSWKAITSDNWIQLSEASGKIGEEQRICVSVDWQNLPAGENIQGEIVFKSKNNKEKIFIPVFNPKGTKDLKGLFVEQNGYISIPAADFHRKTDDGPVSIQVLDNIGVENKSIQFGDPLKRVLDPDASFQTSVEYDFYLFTPGWVTISTYALPVAALNPLENADYVYRIDDGELVTQNIEAGEYSDEWQENVLRNCSIKKHRYYIPAAGKHTFKLKCKAQGMVMQKIVIDTGGLMESYLGPKSTKVE